MFFTVSATTAWNSPRACFKAARSIERHHVQLVHDARAHLHQPVAMPQQLPQITILRIRYPDSREAIFQQQLQQQLRVLAIGLLPAYPLSADRGGIADPQLKLQLGKQALEPAGMPAGFHPHPHGHALCF
jgi:hypothetical protein